MSDVSVISTNVETTANVVGVDTSKTVLLKWSDEFQKWIPEIVDAIEDVEDGTIKKTWKTHLIWLLVAILTSLATYFGTVDTNVQTTTNSNTNVQTTVVDTNKIVK